MNKSCDLVPANIIDGLSLIGDLETSGVYFATLLHSWEVLAAVGSIVLNHSGQHRDINYSIMPSVIFFERFAGSEDDWSCSASARIQRGQHDIQSSLHYAGMSVSTV